MSRDEELFTALEAGDSAQAEALLRAEPRLARARDEGGATPLHWAAERGDKELVRLLVSLGADINARDDSFDATPTGWAIEYLRAMGGALAIEMNAMIHAVRRGDVARVRELLVSLPMLARATDRDGTTALQHAVAGGQPEIAALLRQHSACGEERGEGEIKP